MESPGAQYSVYRVHLLGSQALLEAWSGRLAVAQKLADEALQLARDVGLLVHPAPADAYLALSLVAIHRGHPQSASFARHEGAVRAASNHRTQLMWIAYLHMILAGEQPSPADEPIKAAPPIVRDALDAAAHRAQRLAGADGTPAATAACVVGDAGRERGRRARRQAAGRRARHPACRDIRTAATSFRSRPSSTTCCPRGWPMPRDASPSRAALLTRALELASEHGIVSVFVWAGPEVIRLVESLPAAADAVSR